MKKTLFLLFSLLLLSLPAQAGEVDCGVLHLAPGPDWQIARSPSTDNNGNTSMMLLSENQGRASVFFLTGRQQETNPRQTAQQVARALGCGDEPVEIEGQFLLPLSRDGVPGIGIFSMARGHYLIVGLQGHVEKGKALLSRVSSSVPELLPRQAVLDALLSRTGQARP